MEGNNADQQHKETTMATKTKNVRPLEVKKLDNGTLAVRFSNSPKKWSVVSDEVMIQYIIFQMINR